MNFKTNKIITGVIKKISKKTGQPYIILNYLNEDGSTFSSMLSSDAILPDGLRQLSEVEVVFEITFYNGNVTGLRTTDIKLVG